MEKNSWENTGRAAEPWQDLGDGPSFRLRVPIDWTETGVAYLFRVGRVVSGVLMTTELEAISTIDAATVEYARRQVLWLRSTLTSEESGTQVAVAEEIPAEQPTTPPPTRNGGAIPADIRAYVEYMQGKTTLAGQALELLGTLSTQASRNPALLRDPEWLFRVASALAIMKATGEEMQQYSPVPPDLMAIDDQFVLMGNDLIYIVDQYGRGIDDFDARSLGNAGARMDVLESRLQPTRNQLEAVLDNYR
jgi:hypothetical protein